MKEFKGTKGKWELTEGNEDFRLSNYKNKTIAYIQYGFDEDDLPMDKDNYLTTEEANANAKLIASSKQLLDACKSALSLCDSISISKSKSKLIPEAANLGSLLNDAIILATE